MEKITIYPLKEKKFVYSQIKKIALENNGIIFGCYIINNIISEYYKKEYFKNNNIKNYWDDEYDKKTILRLSLSENISIYFNNDNNIYLFISILQKYFDIKIKYKNIKLHNLNYYYKKIYLKLNYGKTLSFDGFYLKIRILVYSYYNNKNVIKLEPPFNNTGLLHYIFIQDKNSIRISNNTGTNLDLLSISEKINIENIFKDLIINNETYITKTDIYNSNIEITENIINNLYKYDYINWNIKNCDIKTIKYDIENNQESCCICLLSFSKNTKIILHDNKAFHKDCFKTNLNYEELYLNTNDLI